MLFRPFTNHDYTTDYCQVDHEGEFKAEIWSYFFDGEGLPLNAKKKFLAESKRYKDALGVTYVLKFECIKHMENYLFGIYFTRKGLTGNGKLKDANAVLKFFLKKQNQFSIVFTDEDWKELLVNPKFFGFLLYKKAKTFLTSQKLT